MMEPTNFVTHEDVIYVNVYLFYLGLYSIWSRTQGVSSYLVPLWFEPNNCKICGEEKAILQLFDYSKYPSVFHIGIVFHCVNVVTDH